MPDAHSGYGLPIGGVLAVENAVIPYGVGMDIGCRMSLSILDTPVSYLDGAKDKYEKHWQNIPNSGCMKPISLILSMRFLKEILSE